MDEVLYRSMCPEDVEQVAAIEKRIYSRPWTSQAFEDALRQESTIFLVAEAQDRVIGYCGCYQSFEEGEITNVTIDGEWRCRHIGQAMLEQLLICGGEKGIVRFILEVRQSNMPAIALYKKLGFEDVGCRRGFYADPKEDARIMVLSRE